MKKFFKLLIWLVTVAYIFFIFSNSFKTGEISSKISSGLSVKLLRVLNHYQIYIPNEVFHFYLRKFAHFSEFFILGVLVSTSISTFPLIKSKFFNFIIFLLCIPFMDEFIQLFVKGRSSSPTDVLIDSSGMICGAFFIYVISLILKDLFSKK